MAISAYILARNEQHHIVEAIQSITWVDEIIIIDTGSTDNTIALAQQQGTKVISTTFKGFGEARNFAISQCTYDWVFCLDADERCTPELQQELLKAINQPNPEYIYIAPRSNYFLNRWIKYSGWYPDYRHPVLFHKTAMQYTNDQVHESFITSSSVHYCKNPILHYPYDSLEKMLQKTNHYSSLGIDRLLKKNVKGSYCKAFKHGIWAFIRQYFLQRGFMDGWAGFILAFNAMYGTFFRYAKLVEYQSTKK